MARTFLLLLFVGAMPWVSGMAQAQTEKELVAKGQYIFAVAGGCACHSVPKETPHAGGRAFPIPFGTVYSTNITQDKETGLGNWTDQQIRDAMVKGIRHDGSRILPVMPYEGYSGMAQEDLKALIAYLRTLKPVKKATPPLKTWAPFARSLGTPVYLMSLWPILQFAASGTEEWNRYEGVIWLSTYRFAATATRQGTSSARRNDLYILPAPARKSALWVKRYRTLRRTKKRALEIGNEKILWSY